MASNGRSRRLPPVAERVFKTTSFETADRGNSSVLRRDQVRMPGDRTMVRELIEHCGVAAIVAMDGNNIPMVYQDRNTYNSRLWELLTQERQPDLNTVPGFSDESVRIYLVTGLSEVARLEAHDEKADMTMRWPPIDETARWVFSGDIIKSIVIEGILSAHAVTTEFAQSCPLESRWIDKPTAFAARKVAQ